MLKKKKDAFPSNMSDACKLLNGLLNNYGGRSVRTEANDGVAFTTVSEEKDEQMKNGSDVKRSDTTPANVTRNCPPRRLKAARTCL